MTRKPRCACGGCGRGRQSWRLRRVRRRFPLCLAGRVVVPLEDCRSTLRIRWGRIKFEGLHAYKWHGARSADGGLAASPACVPGRRVFRRGARRHCLAGLDARRAVSAPFSGGGVLASYHGLTHDVWLRAIDGDQTPRTKESRRVRGDSHTPAPALEPLLHRLTPRGSAPRPDEFRRRRRMTPGSSSRPTAPEEILALADTWAMEHPSPTATARRSRL